MSASKQKNCLYCNNIFYTKSNKKYCTKTCIVKGRTDEHRKNQSDGQTINFTPEILELIIADMKVSYYTLDMIRRKYDITRSVSERLREEHVPDKKKYFLPSNLTFEDLENISNYSKNGLSYRQIGKLLNRKNGLMKRLIKKLQMLAPDKFFFISSPKQLNRKETKPEKTVREWLESFDISFLQECQLEIDSKWYFDFKLNNMPLLVEVHGDYWHCNPYIYPNGPVNKWQKHSKRRDFQKRYYAMKMGYKRIVIWENSIKTKPLETKLKLLKLITEMNNCKTNKTIFEELGYDISKMKFNKSYGVKLKNYGVLSYNHGKQENCWLQVTKITKKEPVNGFNIIGANNESLLLAPAQHKIFVKLLEDSTPQYEQLFNLEQTSYFYAFYKNKNWIKCTCVNTNENIEVLDCEFEGANCYYSNGILSQL